MKLVTFRQGSGAGSAQVGVVSSSGIVPIAAVARRLGVDDRPLRSMLDLLDSGQAAMDLAQRCQEAVEQVDLRPLPVEEVTVLAPVPRPRSIRDCMAFEQHLLQATRGAADLLYPPIGRLDRFLASLFGRGFLGVPKLFHHIPAYYKGNPASVVGPEATVVWPSYCNRLDYELEFGVFIGKQGTNISEDDAMDYVAGYTIFNDFSARDTQLREMKLRLGPAKGKDFDTGNSMGPWLVTRDEVPDPYNLKMTATVGDQIWTDGISSGMTFGFDEIIAYISRSETLYPGDFIAGGTVGGGCGLEHGRWLSRGDRITLEVEGLGRLSNTIEGRVSSR